MRIRAHSTPQRWPLCADACGNCMQGAKISTLTAAVDDRVKALCLWDPVDVTVYAPQGPEYPSAVAALRHVQNRLPVAVVGGGKAGDCVPKDSNYRCSLSSLLRLPCLRDYACAALYPACSARGLAVWLALSDLSSQINCREALRKAGNPRTGIRQACKGLAGEYLVTRSAFVWWLIS